MAADGILPGVAADKQPVAVVVAEYRQLGVAADKQPAAVVVADKQLGVAAEYRQLAVVLFHLSG